MKNLFEAISDNVEAIGKPYILSDKEFDLVDKVLEKSGMGDSFAIGNYDEDDWDQDKKGDAWWDFEEYKRIPLADGFGWFFDGFTRPEDYNLTKDEVKTLNNLAKKFGYTDTKRFVIKESVQEEVNYKELAKDSIIVTTGDKKTGNMLVYEATPQYVVVSGNPMDTYIPWELNLIGGMNYVDVDDKYNNKQGIIGPENFNDDVQYESFNQYIMQESFIEAAEANDYKLVKGE